MKLVIGLAEKTQEKDPGKTPEKRTMAESLQGGTWVDARELEPVMAWLG